MCYIIRLLCLSSGKILSIRAREFQMHGQVLYHVLLCATVENAKNEKNLKNLKKQFALALLHTLLLNKVKLRNWHVKYKGEMSHYGLPST